MIPVELIRQKDYPAIVDWALALKEKDRLAVLKALQETDYHPLFSGEDVHDAFSLSKVVCARNYTEQKLFPIHWPKIKPNFMNYWVVAIVQYTMHSSLILAILFLIISIV